MARYERYIRVFRFSTAQHFREVLSHYCCALREGGSGPNGGQVCKFSFVVCRFPHHLPNCLPRVLLVIGSKPVPFRLPRFSLSILFQHPRRPSRTTFHRFFELPACSGGDIGHLFRYMPDTLPESRNERSACSESGNSPLVATETSFF